MSSVRASSLACSIGQLAFVLILDGEDSVPVLLIPTLGPLRRTFRLLGRGTCKSVVDRQGRLDKPCVQTQPKSTSSISGRAQHRRVLPPTSFTQRGRPVPPSMAFGGTMSKGETKANVSRLRVRMLISRFKSSASRAVRFRPVGCAHPHPRPST